MYDAYSDCVVVLAIGDLVVWRHSVRGLEGAALRFIIKLNGFYDVFNHSIYFSKQ